MIPEKFWSEDRFPVVYENHHAKAVMVDMDSFRKVEMILDNLMHRESESEDNLLIVSGLLEKILGEVRTAAACDNWRYALDEL